MKPCLFYLMFRSENLKGDLPAMRARFEERVGEKARVLLVPHDYKIEEGAADGLFVAAHPLPPKHFMVGSDLSGTLRAKELPPPEAPTLPAQLALF